MFGTSVQTSVMKQHETTAQMLILRTCTGESNTAEQMLAVSLIVVGEVLGHEDALRQAVGQNIASKGLRLVAPTGTEPPRWLFVVHAVTPQLDVTGLIDKLRSLQGKHPLLSNCHMLC